MSEQTPMNGHAVGIVLKELVRRAIKTIRAEREVFEVTQKAGYGGDMTDVFTTADSKAQRIYVRSLEECFPGFGIIAEEGALSEAGSDERRYFTIDPLDGTKAFIRRRSFRASRAFARLCRLRLGYELHARRRDGVTHKDNAGSFERFLHPLKCA